MPAIGDFAPDFTLATDTEPHFRLADHSGRPVVIYFYPQDDTTGCTVENEEFTARAADFAALGVTVLGVSPDSVESHAKFRQKFALTLPLAADPDHAVIDAYGLWQLKKLYGREYMGVKRATVIVGVDGRIADIIAAPRIKGHAAKVLEAVRRHL